MTGPYTMLTDTRARLQMLIWQRTDTRDPVTRGDLAASIADARTAYLIAVGYTTRQIRRDGLRVDTVHNDVPDGAP